MSTIGFDINQLGNILHKAWESLGHDFLKDNGATICAMNTINKCMTFIKKKDLGLILISFQRCTLQRISFNFFLFLYVTNSWL